MNRKLSSMTLAAFACAAITVAAQEPTAPPAGQAGRTTPSADEATFVGCVAAADTGAAPAAASAGKFVLKDAKKKDSTSASSAKPATPGAPAGTSGTTGMGRTYQLDGSDATIQPEVGHQVEVVATIAEPSASASPSASAGPKLKVKTIKMIAAKCE
jgi:hypothetical protein